MRAIIPLVAVLAICLPGGAMAHRLKVFAAVQDGAVAGYAFFVGGGRPKSVPFTVTDAQGQTLFSGYTDGEGGFRWPAPVPADYTILVNAEDGHVAKAVLPAARFGGAVPTVPVPTPARAAPVATDLDPIVAEAVRREMMPLLQRIEEMDSRMRLTDVVSGLFLILGGAGGAMWLSSRRRG